MQTFIKNLSTNSTDPNAWMSLPSHQVFRGSPANPAFTASLTIRLHTVIPAKPSANPNLITRY